MMQRSTGGSFVCWRCLSKSLQPRPSLVRRPLSAAASRNLSAFRARGTRTFATIQDPVSQPDETIPLNETVQDPAAKPTKAAQNRNTAIRQRLLEWAAQNPIEAPKAMPFDNGQAGRAANNFTRPRGVDESAFEEAGLGSHSEQHYAGPDGSLDLLPPPSNFLPGDLVEYSGSQGEGSLPILAICLGHFNGFDHFYSASGKWYPVTHLQSRFYYRNFVKMTEMKPVIEKLPTTELPLKTVKDMSRLGMGPSRLDGAVLLRRMATFQQMTDTILQKYATRFEMAHKMVSEKQGAQRYLTLEQIRQRLLSGEDKQSPAPAHLLYAVHRIVEMDDVGFRFVGVLGNSSEWLYQVTDPDDVTLIQNMQTLVRLFTDIPGREGTSVANLTGTKLMESQLGRFILKARDAIDASRRSRDWTPHGILGPAKQPLRKTNVVWNAVDMSILRFLLLWAGYDQFSNSSRFHGVGSAILRATGRYGESEYLSTTTAWTFLQEVGYITPWDLHERFSKRVPGAKLSRERGFAPLQLGPEGIKPYLTKDIFAGKRHDWAGLKAFAIDSRDTVDVDDAISIEATDVPGQHWVHIHVANPTSNVRHQNALSQRASVVPLTLYLPGHYSNIWGVKDEMQKLFSLAPGRTCLTFSGLVSDDGQLLEYKITPARIQKFIYMTPEDANAAVGAETPIESPQRFTVGKLPAEGGANREMTAPSALRPADLQSLKMLSRLADARRQRCLAKGAVPSWSARPVVEVFFNDTSIERTPPGLMTCNGDPSIAISWDKRSSEMVGTLMVLAGEIAARWSADRNLPIPYLSQPESEKNTELLKIYTEKVYYPLLHDGVEPSSQQFSQLRALVGPDKLSTTPGRHYLMGVDRYAKVTSPLRRYSDLVAHWQIEAALLHEMTTGASGAEATLPLSREELDDKILPWLSLRQRVINQLGRQAGTECYLLQALLRAWKFPSSSAGDSKLPASFRLTIKGAASDARAHSHSLIGSLDWFSLDAYLVPQGLGPLGLCVADVRVGDVFEVKLLDINLHFTEVLVEAVGKVSVQKDREEVEL